MLARGATPDDLARILAEEARAREAKLILGWAEAQHRAALADPATEYRVYADASGWLGFVILGDLGTPHRCIELTRIVTAEPGKGIGRLIMRDVLHHVFATLGAHRLWLTSFADNARAHHVYRHLGFAEEGVLREDAWRADGFKDTIIFAMLAREWRGRQEGA